MHWLVATYRDSLKMLDEFSGRRGHVSSLKDIFERDGRNGKKKSNPEPLGNDMK